jgi:hypothetical protein
VGRKRKREKERMKGVVRRKVEAKKGIEPNEEQGKVKASPAPALMKPKPKTALVDYGSGSDD